MIPFLQNLFNAHTLQVILGSPLALIILDILTGTFSASKQKAFDPKKLGAFMGKGGLWYVVGVSLVLLASTSFGNALITGLTSLATMAPLAYSTVASIIENVVEMLPQPVGGIAGTVVKDAEAFLNDVGAPIQPIRTSYPVSMSGPGSSSVSVALADPLPAPGMNTPVDQAVTNVIPAMPPAFAYSQQPRA